MKPRRLNRARSPGGRLIPWLSRRPLGPQQVVQVREVLGQARQTDVLEHADRADRVEAAVDVAVVLHAVLDALDAGVRRGLLRVLGLVRRQRDADRLHAVVARRVHDHAAPSAADVEQAHAGAQAELAADQVVLRGLRLLEGGVLGRPHRARVRHRGPEHHSVELVRDVVVVRDRSRVARRGSAAGRADGPLRRAPAGA